MTLLLNYHGGCFVLGSLCVGDLVRLGLSGVRVAGFSLQQVHKSQHTTNREQNNRRDNSTAKSQAPDDGCINVRNMLST